MTIRRRAIVNEIPFYCALQIADETVVYQVGAGDHPAASDERRAGVNGELFEHRRLVEDHVTPAGESCIEFDGEADAELDVKTGDVGRFNFEGRGDVLLRGTCVR